MLPARRRAMATARAAAAAAASAGRLIGWMSVKACRWNGGLNHHSTRGNGHGLTRPLPTLDLKSRARWLCCCRRRRCGARAAAALALGHQPHPCLTLGWKGRWPFVAGLGLREPGGARKLSWGAREASAAALDARQRTVDSSNPTAKELAPCAASQPGAAKRAGGRPPPAARSAAVPPQLPRHLLHAAYFSCRAPAYACRNRSRQCLPRFSSHHHSIAALVAGRALLPMRPCPFRNQHNPNYHPNPPATFLSLADACLHTNHSPEAFLWLQCLQMAQRLQHPLHHRPADGRLARASTKENL